MRKTRYGRVEKSRYVFYDDPLDYLHIRKNTRIFFFFFLISGETRHECCPVYLRLGKTQYTRCNAGVN